MNDILLIGSDIVIDPSATTTSSADWEASTLLSFVLDNLIFPPLIVYVTLGVKADPVTVTLALVFFSNALKSVVLSR